MMPPPEDEDDVEDEMVRGRRKSSAPSDQVSFKREKKTALQSDNNF